MSNELLRKAIDEFMEFYGSKPSDVVSAPGRLDFLNTHQDYKGLPVVGIGIDLRTYIVVSRNTGNEVIAASGNMKDLGMEYVDRIRLDNLRLIGSKWFGDYVRAALITLIDEGFNIKPIRIWIRSSVPIASGLGSSGTLLVSVIGAVSQILGLRLGNKDIAELAYKAEHDVMNIPCGRLDQYSSSFGNIVLIGTKPPYNVDVLPRLNGVFLVFDTGIRHSTSEIHPKRQLELNEGIKELMSINLPDKLRHALGNDYAATQWDKLSLKDLARYLDNINEISRNRIIYTLRAHETTMLAIKVIKGEQVGFDELRNALALTQAEIDGIIGSYDWRERLIGKIMTYQHELLSKYYDVSLPIIDDLVQFLTEHGAYGAKLSGAGLGGAVIALVENKDKAMGLLKGALSKGLASNGWIVNIDEGFRVDYHEE